MKTKRNVLAGVLAIALLGVFCGANTMQKAKSSAVGAPVGEKVLKADGNSPPPPPLPTVAPDAIA